LGRVRGSGEQEGQAASKTASTRGGGEWRSQEGEQEGAERGRQGAGMKEAGGVNSEGRKDAEGRWCDGRREFSQQCLAVNRLAVGVNRFFGCPVGCVVAQECVIAAAACKRWAGGVNDVMRAGVCETECCTAAVVRTNRQLNDWYGSIDTLGVSSLHFERRQLYDRTVGVRSSMQLPEFVA